MQRRTANSTGNRKRATSEKEGAFERGVAHFNARRFFEAHEAWEELWLSAPSPDKTFLQGIIQVAAAFHHWQRGNSSGATSLLTAGLAKIAGFAPERRGIDVANLVAQAQVWVEALAKGARIGEEALPRIRTVRRASRR